MLGRPGGNLAGRAAAAEVSSACLSLGPAKLVSCGGAAEDAREGAEGRGAQARAQSLSADMSLVAEAFVSQIAGNPRGRRRGGGGGGGDPRGERAGVSLQPWV